MKLGQEVIDKINDYYEQCIAKSYKHQQTAQVYKRLYQYTTTPLIVVSSLTTLLASFNGNTPNIYLAVTCAILSGLTTIGQGIVSFFEYQKRYQEHLNISNKYSDLANTIETQLYIQYYAKINETDNTDEDNKFIETFFEMIQQQLHSIQAMTTDILSTNLDNKPVNGIKCGIHSVRKLLTPRPLPEPPEKSEHMSILIHD